MECSVNKWLAMSDISSCGHLILFQSKTNGKMYTRKKSHVSVLLSNEAIKKCSNS